MPSYNIAMIMGHVGQDPEIKSVASGDEVANFSVATSKSWKDKKTDEWKSVTTWHRVVAWGFACNNAKKLGKGDLVAVHGNIVNRSYDDKEGNTKYISEIVADKVMFVHHAGEKKDSGDQSPPPAGAQATADKLDGDDDLPF